MLTHSLLHANEVFWKIKEKPNERSEESHVNTVFVESYICHSVQNNALFLCFKEVVVSFVNCPIDLIYHNDIIIGLQFEGVRPNHTRRIIRLLNKEDITLPTKLYAFSTENVMTLDMTSPEVDVNSLATP